MNGPLGQYSTVVAAITSLGVIAAYVIGSLVNANVTGIHDIALIAVGAVFTLPAAAALSTIAKNGADKPPST